MPSVAVISMDNYNDSSRIVDGNFDDPRLTDYDTLLQNVNDLKAGKPVEVPVYEFKSSSRTGYRTVEVPSSRIVIIEGIYALSEKLRPLLDLRVSVTGGVHFDLVKRVLRDIQRAGQEPEEIIHQISETVYPMYKAFIEPDLQTAHIKIINKFNPFTGFQSPTYILKCVLLQVAVISSLEMPNADFWVIIAVLSTVIGYCAKIYFSFQQNLVAYQNLITQSMYDKQLDSGRGTLLHLCDDVIQQEVKEVILSFYILMEQGKATREDLDRWCEELIKEEFGASCNFDVDDAVEKLEKLGIVSQDSVGRYFCIGLKRANEIIGTTTEELVLKAKQGKLLGSSSS